MPQSNSIYDSSNSHFSRFRSIQVARGLAALSVVIVHAEMVRSQLSNETYSHGLLQFGQAGVDVFFVISGFIIAMVVQRTTSAKEFLKRRVLRIVPFYWLFTFSLILTLAALGDKLPTIQHLVTSLLIVPQYEKPVLGVGWSLEHELIFYAIAALLVAIRQAGRLLLVMAGISLASISLAMLLPAGATFDGYHLFSLYQLQFLMGVAIYRWRDTVGRLPWAPLLVASLLLFPLSAAMLHILHGTTVPLQPSGMLGIARVGLWGTAGVFLLAGLIACEAQKPELFRLSGARILMSLGGASFALYLAHPIVFMLFGEAFRGNWPRDIPVDYAPVAAIVVALVTATLFYRRFERPFLRRLAQA